MIDERDLLERELRRFEPEPGLTERVMRRRDRKRRNQRLRAGALGVAVALAVAIAASRALTNKPEPIVTPEPSPSLTRAFVGLPPEGAEATPFNGERLYYMETSATDGTFDIQVTVFTDGRVTWVRYGDETGVPEGAMDTDTGYLTQVLTPVGVEMLRAEIYDTGFFGDGAAFRSGYAGPFEGDVGRFHGDSGLWLDVYDGRGRPTTLSWYRNRDALFDGPPTPEERQTIGQLVDRLADPASWLPDTAWEERELQAFVATTYTAYICCGSRDIAALPPPADRILRNYEEWYCITTDEAREIAEAFDELGIQLTDAWYPGGITYDLENWPEYRSNDHVLALYPRFDTQC